MAGKALDSVTELSALSLAAMTFVRVSTQLRSLRSLSSNHCLCDWERFCRANVIFRYLVWRPRSPTWVMKSSSPRQSRQLIICAWCMATDEDGTAGPAVLLTPAPHLWASASETEWDNLHLGPRGQWKPACRLAGSQQRACCQSKEIH